MAPEIVWKELAEASPKLKVLDPMAGSGTTLVTAKLLGHEALGFDMDPLAILISNAWLTDIAGHELLAKASEVLARAELRAKSLPASSAYPSGADSETKKFIRYWFDLRNRKQLTALSQTISRLHDSSIRNLLWCAFSRLIITKKVGVSLAMDVSHSRPHRTYDIAPVTPFERFIPAVGHIIKSSPFANSRTDSQASVMRGDARNLPLQGNSVDMVVTSPPYLNAIDYIRGHKLSLVWMGQRISDLRAIRSSNVGSEVSSAPVGYKHDIEHIMRAMCSVDDLSSRNQGMLRRYVVDMREVLSEIQRVLRPMGRAVLVVGDCNLKETFVSNSKGIELLAEELGLRLLSRISRPLPENRRYLPPPNSANAGKALKLRMREEVIISLQKPHAHVQHQGVKARNPTKQ